MQTDKFSGFKTIIIWITFKTGENRYGLCEVLFFGRTLTPGFKINRTPNPALH